MKKNFILVSGIISTLLLSACASEQIEYMTDDSNISDVASQADNQKTTQESVDTTTQSGEGDISVETSETKEKYDDVFTVYDSFGKSYNVRMWVEPQRDEDEYSVYTYEDNELTAQEKEKIVKMFAGGNKVYYYDEQKMPKDAVQKRIDREIERYNSESVIMGFLEEIYKNAPDIHIEAVDYNENEFAYYEDGIPWTISFRTGVLYFYMDGYYEYSERKGETISAEEAQNIIEDVLYNIGLSELKLISESGGKTEAGYVYNYKYVQGADVHEMTDAFGSGLTQWDNYDDNLQKKWTIESEYPCIANCSISQTGHLESISVLFDKRLINVDKNVSLLSEDDVIDIAIDELKNNCDEYLLPNIEKVYYNIMKLGYVIIHDENKYYQIPCWEFQQRAADKSLATAIYINAIDGSIVTNGTKIFEYVPV